MTPAEVDALEPRVYSALLAFQNREVKAANRAARKRR